MTHTHSHTHYQTEEKQVRKPLDVRSKILATFLVVFAVSFIVSFVQLFWFLLLFLLFFIFFKPKKSFLKHTLISFPIIISLSIFSYFSFSSSSQVYRTIFYSTLHNNFSLAMFFGIRSLLIVFFILTLINSEETFFEIIYGLDDLWMPDFLSNLTFLTYRFFYLMQEEFNRILEARSNRLYGQKFYFSLSSLKIIGNIIGSVLARSFKRAEYISGALCARGFTGKMSHTEQPWTFRGIFFLIITFVFIILIMIFAHNLNFLPKDGLS